MAMRKRTKWILVILAVSGVVFIAFTARIAYELVYGGSPAFRQSAIECTLEWARLAPFPDSAEDFTITTGGSPFTRTFVVTFTAPIADIEKWLQDSPGTRDEARELQSPEQHHFEISPGGGAGFAEMNVEFKTGRVYVRTYWS